MNKQRNVLHEISDLILHIESTYPELYRILDETPNTLPTESHPNIDDRVLLIYLDDLRELLRHHIADHEGYVAA